MDFFLLLSDKFTVGTVSFITAIITANCGTDIYAIKKPDSVTNRISIEGAIITAIIDAFV